MTTENSVPDKEEVNGFNEPIRSSPGSDESEPDVEMPPEPNILTSSNLLVVYDEEYRAPN